MDLQWDHNLVAIMRCEHHRHGIHTFDIIGGYHLRATGSEDGFVFQQDKAIRKAERRFKSCIATTAAIPWVSA